MASLLLKTVAYRGILFCTALVLLAGCSSMSSSFNSLMPLEQVDGAASVSGAPAMPLVSIEQAWMQAADDCGKQAGAPEANACNALAQRGRTLQCLASQFTRKDVTPPYPAPDGLENWSRCVADIGQVLAGGYYLRHAEIERRMLLCHANLAAAPDARKLQTRWSWRNVISSHSALEKESRQQPVEYGQALRSPPADLQKCSAVMALTEPMQSPVLAKTAAPAPSAMASPTVPVQAVPRPAAPDTVVNAIEPGGNKPTDVAKPAPVSRKPLRPIVPAVKAKN